MPVSAVTAKELGAIRADYEVNLSDTCNLLTLTRTSDSMGGWTESWGTASEAVPCRVTARTGREAIAGGAIQPYHSYTITLPHDTTITSAYRIEVGTVTYSVTSEDGCKSTPFGLRVEVEKV